MMPKTIDYNWPGWCSYLYTQWFANKKAGHEDKTRKTDSSIIIPQQVQKAMDDGYRNVKVICDDTNVFLLLLYYYQKLNWQNVSLATIDESRKLISIKGTAEKHRTSISWLPAIPTLLQCNTLPKMFGIGKVTALKINTKNPQVSWVIYKVWLLMWYKKQNSLRQDVMVSEIVNNVRNKVKLILKKFYIWTEPATATTSK